MWTLLLTALTALLWLALTMLGEDLGHFEQIVRFSAFGLTMLVGVRVIHALVINAILSAKTKRGYITSDLLRAVLAVVHYMVGFMVFLRAVLHVDVSSVLATSALLSAIIGLALQPTLGHLFSGVAIELERPVRIGDYVSRGQIEGRIISLTWRAVHLLTERGARVVVPNSEFTAQPVEVIPQDVPYRTQTSFSVGSQFPPGQIIRIAMQVVRSGLPAICVEPAPSVVVVDNDGVSGIIRYTIRFYTLQFLNRSSTASSLLERLWYALNREGIELPQPPFHWLALKQDSGPVPIHTLFGHDFPLPQAQGSTLRDPAEIPAEILADLPDTLRTPLLHPARRVRFGQGERCDGIGIALVIQGVVRANSVLTAAQRDAAVSALIETLDHTETSTHGTMTHSRMSETIFQPLLQASTLALGPLAHTLCYRIAAQTEDAHLAYHAIARSIPGPEARQRFLSLAPQHPVETLYPGQWFGWTPTADTQHKHPVHCYAAQDCSILVWQPVALAACLEHATPEALERFARHLHKHAPDCTIATLQGLRTWTATHRAAHTPE
jgi:small-conductance mechanosensitive channel